MQLTVCLFHSFAWVMSEVQKDKLHTQPRILTNACALTTFSLLQGILPPLQGLEVALVQT